MFHTQQPEAPVAKIEAAAPSVDVVDEAPKPAVEQASQPPLESVRISLTQLVAPPVESVFVEQKQSAVTTEVVESVANNTVINGEAPKEPEVVAVINMFSFFNNR